MQKKAVAACGHREN